jgi:hypothetical protein
VPTFYWPPTIKLFFTVHNGRPKAMGGLIVTEALAAVGLDEQKNNIFLITPSSTKFFNYPAAN